MINGLKLQVMSKWTKHICLILFLLINLNARSQNVGNIFLRIHFVDDSSAFQKNNLLLITNFEDTTNVIHYVKGMLNQLRNIGYVSASADSLIFQNNSAHLWLFIGKKYPLKFINEIDLNIWNQIRNYELEKNNDWFSWQIIREKVVLLYEQIGYPFAEASLDSMWLKDDTLYAVARINPGVKYHIDSVRLYGKIKLRNRILQQQIGIFSGSFYNRKKLDAVDDRLSAFPFAKKSQPSDVSFLGSGGVLNVYLNPQKCSQLDLMLGLQPASSNSGKAQLIGNAQLDLKNAFGNAERIFFQWQQLQVKSPRLSLAFAQPFVFGTAFGTDIQFGLFKKDSSFLQLRGSMAITRQGIKNHSTSFGFSFFQNILLEGSADTNKLIQLQKMPDDIDSKSMNLMLGFSGRTTNHPENPSKGWEYQQTIWAGNREVIRNQTLLNVKSKESFVRHYYDSVSTNTYQIRYLGSLQKYISLGKYSVMMLASQYGYFQSRNIFRTDLFQIGGNKLLRGFDEESIFANKYTVFTSEYRFQLSESGYAQLFTDVGFVNNQKISKNKNTRHLGVGIGLVYPTDNGRLKLSLAVGRRSDVPFVLRQSIRIHLGYVNYF